MITTMLKYLSIFLTVIFVSLKLFIKLRTKWCKSKTTLVGKTVIVTGANTGIGFEAALNFATRGAKLILACRDVDKANDAKNKIKELTGNSNVIVKYLDFSSLNSVRKFVENIKSTEERLDILVNNAGCGGLANKTSVDNLQLVMQINYFGPFLLTILLIDLLKKCEPSRIVNVSSIGAKYIQFELKEVNTYSGHMNTYKKSKLCNILFTKELARRLQSTQVTVYSLHPGAVNTEIFRRVRGTWSVVLNLLKKYYFKTSEEGAQTTIYTAVEKGIENQSGGHFDECRLVKDYENVNANLAKQVWDVTEELLKLQPHEKIM